MFLKYWPGFVCVCVCVLFIMGWVVEEIKQLQFYIEITENTEMLSFKYKFVSF